MVHFTKTKLWQQTQARNRVLHRLLLDRPCRDDTGITRPADHPDWPDTGECVRCYASRGAPCRKDKHP